MRRRGYQKWFEHHYNKVCRSHPDCDVELLLGIFSWVVLALGIADLTQVISGARFNLLVLGRTVYHIHHDLVGMLIFSYGLFYAYHRRWTSLLAYIIMGWGLIIWGDAALTWGNVLTFITSQ
jgi:hypothetical protein